MVLTKKCKECGAYVRWLDKAGVCYHCRNGYSFLLSKIGPARMEEIRREAATAVRGCVATCLSAA
jgi:hypothetical protein